MDSVTRSNFGFLIAYIVPGVTALWGLEPFVPLVRTLFAPADEASPTVGGFLYLTVASLAMGMTISAIRWAIIDSLHEQTGLRLPPFNFAKLGENVAAYETLNHIHYQHYLFYANMFVASAIAYAGQRLASSSMKSFGWIDVAFLSLEAIFFATSRDTLGKYYRRVSQLLDHQQSSAD